MKSFKQFDEAYTDRYAHRSAEDDNKGLFNVQDPKSLQQLNGFVGALSDREYLQPEAAMEQLNRKLEVVGLNFKAPEISGEKGNAKVEVTQFGGRYGKTPDSKTSGVGDIENVDGVSHKKEGGLKIEFNWEKQANNTYKVFANLV